MSISRREFVKDGAAVGLAVGAGLYWRSPASSEAAELPPPLKPPGALLGDDFAATCIRCQRCVDACPNHALTALEHNAPRGRGGTPTMHPRKAACMLCAREEVEYLRCTEACPSGALQLVRKEKKDIHDKVAIGVAEIDFDLCYSYNNWSCGACFRACPLAGEAMTVGLWERPEVHTELCVGCGCCERSCIRYPHAIRIRSREA